MNAVRRTAVLLGLAVALVVGSSLPASAAWSASSVAVPAKVSTGTVAPPTGVTLAGTGCPWLSQYNQVLRVKLAWQKSATPTTPSGRIVTGYRITALYGTTEAFTETVPADATPSLQRDFPVQYAQAGIHVTVTTLTNYGWTATSTTVGPIKC